MNIFYFLKTLLKNLKYLIAIPALAGILMFLLTRNQERNYSSRTTIFTGITSSSSIVDVGSSRVDYFATQNAYNNTLSILQSHSVLEETGREYAFKKNRAIMV